MRNLPWRRKTWPANLPQNQRGIRPFLRPSLPCSGVKGRIKGRLRRAPGKGKDLPLVSMVGAWIRWADSSWTKGLSPYWKRGLPYLRILLQGKEWTWVLYQQYLSPALPKRIKGGAKCTETTSQGGNS